MATVKLYFDKRRKRKNETYPLKLKLFHNNQATYIALKYAFKESQWIESENKVKSSYKNSTRVNNELLKILYSSSTALIENEYQINSLSIDDLKQIILNAIYGKGNSTSHNKTGYLFEYMEVLIDRMIKAKKVGNAAIYRTTLNVFKTYRKNKDILLPQINHKFLVEFETECLSRNLKVNTISVYLRTLRASINRAIDEGLLPQEKYPFRKFQIKTAKTAKRAITKEEITIILEKRLEPNTNLWHSKNYFTFMFNMRGMNFIDLAFLTMDNLHNDRIVYTRAKTGKLYNIKLTVKAKEILKHYIINQKPNSEEFIFPIMPEDVKNDTKLKMERYKNRIKYFNKDLKEIAELCKLDINLTSYVSRHTWASIAKFAGISHAIIGESLGHSDLKTTETYLANFNNDVLDDANDLIVG